MEPRRIVIAEDYDDFREMLTLALSLAFPNTEIESVADGRAALAAFDRNRPSVVIVDLQMPELDGLELTRLLRARDPLGRIPIIVLTASGGSSDWKRLSAMGADRLLVKPVVIDDVVNVVRRSLRERSAASSTAP
jgi:DNA-binding response OmpR family regulator